jgi:LPXTG-motif cell wall-anchored protein
LTDGRLIPWQLTGQTWLVLAGGYAVILGLLGAGWFSRRELGLPAE